MTHRRPRTPATRALSVCAALSLLPHALTNTLAAQVRGHTSSFTSPNGVDESCVVLDRFGGGAYSESDREREAELCGIDFYAPTIALCPKIWSTSPGTIVYDVAGTEWEGDPVVFEEAVCREGKRAEDRAGDRLTKYKQTMNQRNTSGTFSTSSLLYYHFSRYFNTAVHVPVATYRTMDRAAHRTRVTRRGVSLSDTRGRAMIHAGWVHLENAEGEPSTYRPTDDLFTPNRSSIYGVLLDGGGTRYGPEINGTRASGWGTGQNRDFQRTGPFLALKQAAPLEEAIQAGIREARRDPAMRDALPAAVEPEQMVYWMTELTEITLLDYILSQQDRVGNIDYREYWYWRDGNAVGRGRARTSSPPAEIAGRSPVRLRRTQLNDNDAGGRVQYANFTKTTEMIEGLRHYRAETYRQLMALSADFAAQGPLFRYVRDTFGLDAAQFRQIVTNTGLVTDILKESCREGRLRFDLDPEAFFLTGRATEEPVPCEGG